MQGSVSGLVRRAGINTPIAGAKITIGNLQTVTGADGRFQLDNVPGGPTTIRGAAPGFGPYEASITVAAGVATHDMVLAPQDVFEFSNGNYSLYVPTSVTTVRGIVFAIGGPDTRPFANAARSFGLPPGLPPDLEPSLMMMGASYRALAAAEGLAILGVPSQPNLSNLVDALAEVLAEASEALHRPELTSAPLLLHGVSGGTPQAMLLAAQLPSRVAGVFLRVPVASAMAQISPASGSVPTFVVIAELDILVDNNVTTAVFSSVRGGGGLWALAVERGAAHHALSAAARALILDWMLTILDLRLPVIPGGPVRPVDETSGWLGNLSTRTIASWANYVGDRRAAAWLPTQAFAERWRNFVQ